MIYTTLIEPHELHALLVNQKISKSDNLLVLDASCSITEPDIGKKNYAVEHIPGAVFIDFDKYVTGKVAKGTGRHPMPDRAAFEKNMQAFGVDSSKQIVIYDQGGLGFSTRLWYELRWLGYERVAVLNGGLKGWKLKKLPLTGTPLEPQPSESVTELEALEVPVQMKEVQDNLKTHEFMLIDARPETRFHGIGETIDHKAGHIPGAVCRSGSECFDENGFFKSAPELRKEFLALLNGKSPKQVIHSCGSGVNASVNLFAMDYCGLFGSRLYPGSFSQWIDFEENSVVTD